MGAYNMYKDVPLTAVVTKMLCILPEEPMTPRLADSRLGLTTQLKSDYSGATQEVKSIRYAKRWRIEPSDSAAYRAGSASQTTGVLYRQSDACQMESVYQGWCGIVE